MAKVKIFSKVKQNISLKNFTTFKIGGKAKYFFEAKTKEELLWAIKFAKEKRLPIFILGGGSNVLVSDKGFEGMVIKVQSSKFPPTLKLPPSLFELRRTSRRASKVQNYNSECKIQSGAGVELNQLIKISLRNNLTGLEWAIGIPGTVGGAIYGNIGAFGSSIKDVIEEVEVLDTKELKEKIFQKEDCCFSYKESIFKKNKNLIIISCILSLKKGDKKEIKEKINYYLNYRQKNHPSLKRFLSAGCVFENFSFQEFLKNKKKGKVLRIFPEMKKFKEKGFIPAAFLIEKCGLKGEKIGRAQISPKHANFIINLGGAKALDVFKLIELEKKQVKKKFGILLKEEVQYVGRF